jgi:molybdopterin molybdotransferase
VLEAGTTLGPVELANLIACGVREVGVARPVRLAIVSTGDEVVRGPDELGPGKIIDTNGPLLRGLAGRFGMTVAAEELLPDDREATVRGLRAALEAADIVVASGGVSVGDYDFVLEGFSQVGLTVHFSRVAVKPGKPTVFATGPEEVVFGLPGNPVSVLLMFHLFVVRAAALLSGARPGLRETRLRLGADFRRRRDDRREYVPGRVGPDGVLEPIECHGSAHLLALVRADGFFVVPAGVLELARGDEVGFVPLHGSWR